VPHAHLAPFDSHEADFIAVAERFVGMPYLWGGKTALGLDCSGLVQVALTACGIACPRDSDMQERALGSAVADPALPPHAAKGREGTAGPKRGDLIFWKGHVAIARDHATLIHANAFHMAVTVEPIAGAVARIRESGSNITSVRRIVAQSEGGVA
jgi:cell wall-associated NlpC family hydrolase